MGTDTKNVGFNRDHKKEISGTSVKRDKERHRKTQLANS